MGLCCRVFMVSSFSLGNLRVCHVGEKAPKLTIESFALGHLAAHGGTFQKRFISGTHGGAFQKRLILGLMEYRPRTASQRSRRFVSGTARGGRFYPGLSSRPQSEDTSGC